MNKRLYILLLAALAILAGCSNQGWDVHVPGNGRPAEIDYVRTADPEKADSAITSAEKLQTIIIIGRNLQAVCEVWFDDDQASLNPTYVTATNIILSVPFSETHTYKMRLVTTDKMETKYDFETFIPAPRLDGLKSEFVPAGQEAVINGSFFYEPLHVWFTAAEGDSVEATITESDGNTIHCIVPETAEEGYLTVSSKYGMSASDFRFRDHTGMIVDFNHGVAWGNPWGMGKVDNVDPCDSTYLLLKREQVAGWFWSQEDLAGCYWDCYDAMLAPFAPAGASVTEYALRFEANVITWTDVPMHIWLDGAMARFGLDPITDAEGNIKENFPQLHWAPWLVGGSASAGWDVQEYHTDGWETFTFPLTDFCNDKVGQFGDGGLTNLNLGDLSTYEKINIMVFGDLCDATQKHDIHICMDNLRIVPLNSKNPRNK